MNRELIEAAKKEVACATENYMAAAEFSKAPMASRSYAKYVQAAFELRRSKVLLERAIAARGRSVQVERCLLQPESPCERQEKDDGPSK
ncbi:hypothetical protein RBI14_17170 [Alcaligenaceae bacterium B3P038]|nr:hypothetical protein [Alcaligenaceae bacterium B3P038]